MQLVLNKITLTPQGTQKVLLQLKEIQRLREHKVTATGPAGATGGAGPSTRCYTSEGDNRCSVREHKVTVTGPVGATGGAGSTTRSRR